MARANLTRGEPNPTRDAIASVLGRAAQPLLASQDGGPSVEKLRGKIARNLDLGWKVFLWKGLRFAGMTLVSHYRLRDVTRLGVGVRIEGRAPRIDNPGGTIVLGHDVVFSSPTTPTYIAMYPNAFLSIGDESFINDGVWFGCTERIIVGARALIGPGVRIYDNNYHDACDRRRVPPAKPVTIAEDVRIASDSTVLPGVTIGRGGIVAASSLVRDDVAPFTVVAGNPARKVDVVDPVNFGPREPT